MIRALALLVLAALALIAAPAGAQAAPDIRVDVDSPVVGVGDVVHLQMSATSQDGMPDEPRLAPTPGLTVRAQNASPSQTHISINGVRSDRYTLTVDWALQADRVGSFIAGPPSVVVGGTRY
jgi:hypothetical protein